MSKYTSFVDLSRAEDLEYILQDEICRYLYKINYEYRFNIQVQEGVDPELLFPGYPVLLYQSFRANLRELSAENDLKEYVQSLIATKALQKAYIQETCVVCLENPSTIILDCSRQSLCSGCFKIYRILYFKT